MATDGDRARVEMSKTALPAALLDAMTEALYTVDPGRRITYWNRAAERLTGFAAADVIGRRCRDNVLNHVDENGTELCRGRCPLQATMRDGRPRNAYVFLHHRDGHRVPVAISAAALCDDDGRIRGAVEVFHDDSRNRTITARLSVAEAAALTDPLTGIGNRRMVERELRRCESEQRRHGRRFAVLFADIDEFKTVNDRYGHEAGDRLLKVVASTVHDCVRPSDAVGRWGGDEFVVVATLGDQQHALILAERVRNLVASAWIEHDRHRVGVTLSVGVAVVRDGEAAGDLVDRADAAMFFAKNRGRNRSVLR